MKNNYKRHIILCCMLLICNVLCAQDIIVCKDATEIAAKVEAVGAERIKYRRYSNIEGPLYSIARSEVFIIRFEDGERLVVQEQTSSARETSEVSTTPNLSQLRNTAIQHQDKKLHYSLSAQLGYMVSAGDAPYDGPTYGLRAMLEWYPSLKTKYGMAVALGWEGSTMNFLYIDDARLTLNTLNIDALWTHSARATKFFYNMGFRLSVPLNARMYGSTMTGINNTVFGFLASCGWRFNGFQVGASFFCGFNRRFDLGTSCAPIGPSIFLGYRF